MTGRPQDTALTECQCEHASHTEGCGSTEDLTTVRSAWGRYAICKQCRTDHPIPNEYLLPSGEYYVGEEAPQVLRPAQYKTPSWRPVSTPDLYEDELALLAYYQSNTAIVWVLLTEDGTHYRKTITVGPTSNKTVWEVLS